MSTAQTSAQEPQEEAGEEATAPEVPAMATPPAEQPAPAAAAAAPPPDEEAAEEEEEPLHEQPMFHEPHIGHATFPHHLAHEVRVKA